MCPVPCRYRQRDAASAIVPVLMREYRQATLCRTLPQLVGDFSNHASPAPPSQRSGSASSRPCRLPFGQSGLPGDRRSVFRVGQPARRSRIRRPGRVRAGMHPGSLFQRCRCRPDPGLSMVRRDIDRHRTERRHLAAGLRKGCNGGRLRRAPARFRRFHQSFGALLPACRREIRAGAKAGQRLAWPVPRRRGMTVH